MDILTAVLQAPVNTILIIAGAAILFFALFDVGKGAVRLRSGKANMVPIVVGTVLVLVGLLYKPEGRSQEEPALQAQVTFGSQTPLPPVETSSSTPEPPTASPTTVPTSAPTATPEFASFGCLSSWRKVDSGRIIASTSTAGSSSATPDSCLTLPELGISVVSGGLNYSQDGLRDISGVFGISHSIQQDYAIHLTVTTQKLFNAEFWVAVSTEESPTISDVVSVVMVPGTERPIGTLAVYRNSIKRDDKKWFEIDKNNLPGPPFTYQIEIRITGGSVAILVNGQKVADEKGIFPAFLFLGYQKKASPGTILVDANVSGLNFEAIP